jgi:hypothetical protein
MSEFIPAGYVPSETALLRAVEMWFEPELADLQRKYEASSHSSVSDDPLRNWFARQSEQSAFLKTHGEPLLIKARDRFRQFLFEKKLTAYYFSVRHGRQAIEHRFWAAPEADGVIETGQYYPFGKPRRLGQSFPCERVLIQEAELLKAIDRFGCGAQPAPLKNRGGRSTVVDWPTLEAEAARLMDYHGPFSDSDPHWNAQARLVEALLAFSLKKFGKEPGASTLRQRLPAMLKAWEAGRSKPSS